MNIKINKNKIKIVSAEAAHSHKNCELYVLSECRGDCYTIAYRTPPLPPTPILPLSTPFPTTAAGDGVALLLVVEAVVGVVVEVVVVVLSPAVC